MTSGENLHAADYAAEIFPGEMPGGPSTSQTIMVSSLRRLLSEVAFDSAPAAYRLAVIEQNVLAKDTASGREWAFRQLRRFYALDPQVLLFRALRDVWDQGSTGQPLLALLCAMARDPVLRASSSVVLAAQRGAVVRAKDFEEEIESAFPQAYRDSTRQAASQKVASSWAQSGHLHSERPTKKVRSRAHSTPAAVAYALLLGHLQGIRGQALLDTLWMRMLDRPRTQLLELAVEASQQGILELRDSAGVVEITFHHMLRPFDGVQGKS